MWALVVDNDGKLTAYLPWVPDDDDEEEDNENGVFVEQRG